MPDADNVQNDKPGDHMGHGKAARRLCKLAAALFALLFAGFVAAQDAYPS